MQKRAVELRVSGRSVVAWSARLCHAGVSRTGRRAVRTGGQLNSILEDVMASRFPLGKKVVAVAMSAPQQRETWTEGDDGRRRPSGVREVDSQGRPVSSVQLWCVSELADPSVVQAELADDLVESVQVGTMMVLSGRVVVDLYTTRDSREIRSRLDGVEAVTVIDEYASASAWAEELISHVGA